MGIQKKIIITCMFLLICVSLLAYQKPYVANFSRDKYHAANKNWSIGQDERGIMYFGNDIGLLASDGMEWKLFQTPNANLVRAIAVESHQTIYSGGDEDLGRWDRDQSGELKYTSLKGLIKGHNPLDNQSFWRIWIDGDEVYFQTFRQIYVYDHHTITPVDTPKDYLFLLKVRSEYWVQEPHGALYQLANGALNKASGSEFLDGTITRVVLPYDTNRYLIGVSTGEIYIYDGKNFIPWNLSLSHCLEGEELNCAIYSAKRNTYYLGTQLNGIYEVDTQGNILNHFSTANTLQNNTVLSLYEDSQNNIWAALDRGITYIRYTDGLSYYRSADGSLGAVYDAIIWHNNLLIGTNQGVYYNALNKLNDLDLFSSLKLIDGTQGQVWSFRKIDGRLFCAQTNGLLEISPDLHIRQPYRLGTGAVRTFDAIINGKPIQIIITYKNLLILNKATGELNSMQQISDPIYNAETDHLGNIWLQTATRGVYKCRLNDELNAFRYYTYYSNERNSSLPVHLQLFKSGGRILFLGDNRFYIYDEVSDDLQLEQHLNTCFEGIHDFKRIIPINGEHSWAVTGSSVYNFFYDGYIARIQEAYKVEGDNLSLITAYENISVLNDSLSLICLDAGFILHNSYHSKQQNVHLSAPNLEFVHVGRELNAGFMDLSQPIHVPYKENTITVGFSVNAAFAGNLSIQYQLEKMDSTWSVSKRLNSVSYARLPQGKYVLRLRTTDGLNHFSPDASLAFEILPPWYNTIWWYLTCGILIIVILIATFNVMKRRLQAQEMRRIKAQEAKQLRLANEQLQNEIEEKDAEILTQTSFIIHKNELILKIKKMVDELCIRNTQRGLLPLYQKINVLLADNLDTEDDWKMFLIKFEQKHHNFFKRLKEIHPQLTNNDLRLCACLKLNLETKDIASLMNLSIRAVENSRYRLRKKLNLNSTQNLNEYFLNID